MKKSSRFRDFWGDGMEDAVVTGQRPEDVDAAAREGDEGLHVVLPLVALLQAVVAFADGRRGLP